MMLAWLIESSIVAMVVLTIVSFRRITAPLRHAFLLIALVKFAVPPFLVIPVDFIWSVAPSASLRAGAALQIAHAVGAALVVAMLIGRLKRLNALARRAELTTSDDFVAVAREVGVMRMPRLLVSDEPVAPVSFGILRPSVLVSRDLFERLDATQLRVVFAHELVHHRRGDLIVGYLQAWLTALWWFNPLFHLVARRIEQAREEACDDFLLSRRLTTDDQYCALLLDAARSVQPTAFAIPVASMAQHPLDRRVRRIMTPQLTRRDGLSRFTKLLLVATALFAMLGYESPWS